MDDVYYYRSSVYLHCNEYVAVDRDDGHDVNDVDVGGKDVNDVRTERRWRRRNDGSEDVGQSCVHLEIVYTHHHHRSGKHHQRAAAAEQLLVYILKYRQESECMFRSFCFGKKQILMLWNCLLK